MFYILGLRFWIFIIFIYFGFGGENPLKGIFPIIRMPYKNIEDKNKNQKQYYQQNKDILNNKQSSRVECGCGVNHTKRHHAAHVKTPRHRTWLETVPPI